jgi:hypothetical protein
MSSRLFFIICLLHLARSQPNYLCNSLHKGPYLQLAEKYSGLFNQWMNMQGNIYAAFTWTRATGGTVVLPKTAKTRESFDEKLTKMEDIPLGSMFDLQFMHSALAQKGLEICYPTDEWSKLTTKYTRIFLPVRQSGLDFGYSPERTITEATKLGLKTGEPKVVFVGTSNFGGVQIPANTTNYFDSALSMSRDAAIAVQFSIPIKTLAHKVAAALRNYAADRAIVGIHVRLEEDWDIASPAQAATYLAEYKREIEQATEELDEGFVLYLSHGTLPPAIKALVEEWARPYTVVRKDNFLSHDDLKSVCFECQAAIEAEVLLQVDEFVGCAFSSFSYIVSEYRNFLGLPFAMMRKPGFSIFYPVYSPRKNYWHLAADATQPSVSNASPSDRNVKVYPHLVGPKEFLNIAKDAAKDGQPSDKVSVHVYNIMYGIFLVPMAKRMAASGKRKLKMLEIGMGCDMFYGPGKSVSIWKRLLGNAGNIWEADYNVTCVENAVKNKQLVGVNPLVGDQSDRNVLERWVKTSHGHFDAIIDDGGHTNDMIYNSFDVLFHKALAPGGLYFIEDMHVGRLHGPHNGTTMPDLIQAWTEQLLIPNCYVNNDTRSTALRLNYPIPPSIKWIFCQAESCVIAKCEFRNSAGCKPSYY